MSQKKRLKKRVEGGEGRILRRMVQDCLGRQRKKYGKHYLVASPSENNRRGKKEGRE